MAIAVMIAAITNTFAIKPKVDYQPGYFEIMGVEVLDTCTRIKLALKHQPNYWVQLNPMEKQYLIADDDTTRKYRCIGAENLEFDKHIYVRESGKHEGVLIFEKIPDNVKILDYVSEGEKPSDCIWGIHLDEEETDYPQMIDMEKLLTEKSSEKWTGLDPKRNPDIPFYTEGGTTHIRGKINNYHPLHDFTTITLPTDNYVNGKNNVNIGEINPDGSFAFDVKVDYPQYSYFLMGDRGKEIFLMPGDTLDIVTTTLTDYTNPKDGYLKYFGFNGEIDDATIVNMLTGEIYSHYNIKDLFNQNHLPTSNINEDEIYKSNEKISQALDRTVEDLPNYLGDLNASTFAKDMLASYIIGQIDEIEESNELNFFLVNQPLLTNDSLGNYTVNEFKTLDLKRLFEPKRKHNQIIYSNPLMICAHRFLPNRWQFGNLFMASTAAADGTIHPLLIKKVEELMPEKGWTNLSSIIDLSSFDLIKQIDADNEEKTGVGNCFAAQLSRVNALIAHNENWFTPNRETLARINKYITNLSSLVDYPTLSKALLDTYAGFAEEVALEESNVVKKSEYSMVDADKNADVLTELIKPYLGNLIYIDFWGLGCGPCRSGMIAQKSILEKFADKPFKVLYVTEDTDMERCNRFLDKEGIKGEHIYVSRDNWNRLNAYFNFTGIPFGVLIGKEGELLKTHFLLDYPDGDREIERHLNE